MIDFVSPTPANGSSVSEPSIYVNTSVTGGGTLSAFVDFNRSLIGYWSFNNLTEYGARDSSSYGNDGKFGYDRMMNPGLLCNSRMSSSSTSRAPFPESCSREAFP